MLEPLVKRRDAHCLDPLGDKVADGIFRHGRNDAGAQTKTVRQIGRAIKFAAADVDRALGGLAKRDDPGSSH